MSEELHRRLREFLVAEVNRRDERQCVRIELFYAPRGSRPTPLKDWSRKEYPEIFESLTLIEKLTTTLIEAAEYYADSFQSGKHRFEVWTKQHLGSGAQFAFVMQPAATAVAAEDTALAAPGGGASGSTPLTEGTAAHVIATLTRAQQSMFDGTVRVLGATNASFREENTELRERVRSLERELDQARSERLEREHVVRMEDRRQDQRSEALGRLLQLASILAGRFVAGDGTGPNAAQNAGQALRLLIAQFAKSLRPEQIQAVFGSLDQVQQGMLMEIMTIATRDEAQPGGPGTPNGVSSHGPVA
jgi:hypothetical protein